MFKNIPKYKCIDFYDCGWRGNDTDSMPIHKFAKRKKESLDNGVYVEVCPVCKKEAIINPLYKKTKRFS